MLPTGPILVIDAAAPLPIAGVWRDGAWLAYARSDAAPVESLFPLIQKTLGEAGVGLSDISGYIFTEGPGSVLGLRSAAMALRTWSHTPGLTPRPVFTVNSLALAAALAVAKTPELATAPFTVFAAARRDRWNAFTHGDGAWAECDAAALTARPAPHLKLPAREFATTPVPASDFDTAAAFAAHPEVLTLPGLLRPTAAPDAANHANTYVTWTGDRHRADSQHP